MPTPHPIEREVKLRFPGVADARDAVAALGATPLRDRRLQEDCLLDTETDDLKQRRSALRVRMEAGQSRVTFKGPVQPGPMKIREEQETLVGDGDVLLRVFAELGFRPWFRYQKYREEFSLPEVVDRHRRDARGRLRGTRGKRVRDRQGRGPTWTRPRRLRPQFLLHPLRRVAARARKLAHRHGLRPGVTRLPSALVLTAGLGTRLWPLTARRAKPAVPLAGPTLIERILTQLVNQGIGHAVLNLHHRPESIARLVGDGTGCGLRVRYSLEPAILGSAGGPRRALPLLDDDPFLIVNGDTMTDVDLRAMLEAHRRSDAEVTLAVVPNPAPHRYGGVVIDADDRVVDFTRPGAAPESWHFVGVQVATHATFAGLEDGVAIESVNHVYRRRLSTAPGAVRAFRCGGRFLDVGRPADYLEAALALAASPNDLVSPGADVAPSAHLDETIVWPGAVIGPDVSLARCIVSDGVRVPRGFTLEGRVIVPADGLVPRAGDTVLEGMLVSPL